MVVGEITQKTDLLVIGAGPGGYSAAFRAADLGLDVTIVDKRDGLGGVCLNEGCIPSKTLLHAAELIHDAEHAEYMGLTFAKPKLDLQILNTWKNSIITKLTKGLDGLSDKRGIQYLSGTVFFEDAKTARLMGADVARIKFRHAIIATGSSVQPLPADLQNSSAKIMDSSAALALKDIPSSLLVIGGGYIALELSQVYGALGSNVSMLVRSELLRGLDRDLVKPLAKQMESLCEEIYYKTTIQSLEVIGESVKAVLQNESGEKVSKDFDRVLFALGRIPNSTDLGLDKTKIFLDDKGFIQVNEKLQTAEPNIHAIGDVVNGPMLAHKAMHQGKVAAEVIAGKPEAYDVRAVPAVVYTNPQIAWAGLTEEEAREQGIEIQVTRFPWRASGRALTMGAEEGLTKLIMEAESGRLLGAAAVGRGAEGLIAECVVAIEMGALAQDIALSIHPHPTLSETVAEAAEIFLGSSTHFIV